MEQCSSDWQYLRRKNCSWILLGGYFTIGETRRTVGNEKNNSGSCRPTKRDPCWVCVRFFASLHPSGTGYEEQSQGCGFLSAGDQQDYVCCGWRCDSASIRGGSSRRARKSSDAKSGSTQRTCRASCRRKRQCSRPDSSCTKRFYGRSWRGGTSVFQYLGHFFPSRVPVFLFIKPRGPQTFAQKQGSSVRIAPLLIAGPGHQ